MSELEKLLNYVEKCDPHIKALKTIGPELEKLNLRAVEKIRDFLLKLIESLKTPNTNIAMSQQTVLLKYKELFWYLMDKFPEVGLEIHANYVFILI